MKPTPLHGLALGLTALTLACEGYADLPLALRERGALSIAAHTRHTEGPSRVELTLEPPGDAIGPFTIVGHPAALSAGASVQSWALGRCDGGIPATGLTVCASIRFGQPRETSPLAVAVVIESRGDGRRFTLVGAEGDP